MLSRYYNTSVASIIRRLVHNRSQLVSKPETLKVIDTRDFPSDDFVDLEPKQKSVLEQCEEDISHVAPYLQPSFNFAAYVNKSETLQQLVKLGVDLHKLEKKADLPKYILGLDFERNMKNHLLFLSDLGVSVDELGRFLTKNPYIFREELDDLAVRVHYLQSKRFSDEMITRIVSKNPYWLLFSTQKIDQRLGFFQKEFLLTGNEVRQLSAHQPRLITYSMAHIRQNRFVIKEEMGFTPEETKSILLKKPYVFMKSQDVILKAFEFIHKQMGLPIERICEFPEALTCREFKLKQRHTFLEKLGRAQYNANEPNYVSLLALIAGSDAEFCENVAKSSIQAFNTFLKSI